MSKHGFLDMIKSTAAEKSIKEEATSGKQKVDRTESKTKWNALKDDYMLSSKLKDWDKRSSDEESLEQEDDEPLAEWSDN